MPRERVAHHILPTAATMAGVCITVVSIIKLTELSRSASTIIDDVLAVDSVLFLASGFLSYLSLRTNERMALRLENSADALFLLGMLVMVACAFLLVYALGDV
jgi:hypothetical protein